MTTLETIKIIVAGSLLVLFNSFAHADLVVIVSAKNSTTELSPYQIAEIFLGKSATFSAGVSALPFDQKEGSAAREEFYLKIVGKTSPQMMAYWSKMIFTGQGKPPTEMGDSLMLKKQVATNINAVGYIDKNAVDSSVRVMLKLY